jgi:hypothetical protein
MILWGSIWTVARHLTMRRADSLHSASVDGRVDVVRRLLDRGADVNERDEYLQTPLIVASRHGKLAIARTLIKYGADVNSRDNLVGPRCTRQHKKGTLMLWSCCSTTALIYTPRSGKVELHCTSHRAGVTSKLCGRSLNGEQMCKYGMCMAGHLLKTHYCLDTRVLRSYCQSMMLVDRYSTNQRLI